VWAFREMQIAILWMRILTPAENYSSIAALGFINTWMLRCGRSLAFREFCA
jgi:hypothetical protein